MRRTHWMDVRLTELEGHKFREPITVSVYRDWDGSWCVVSRDEPYAGCGRTVSEAWARFADSVGIMTTRIDDTEAITHRPIPLRLKKEYE